jgi:hypothetical protein
VKVYEDSFARQGFTPPENEIYQRRKMAEFLGPGGWHIQLDCDEYFLDFGGFVKYLHKLDFGPIDEINICCPVLTLFRQTRNGFLYVDPVRSDNLEFFQIASQRPTYHYGRRNGFFNIYTNFTIIHQSWARTPEEIKTKLSNWGHKNDFDQAQFYACWSGLDDDNFHSLKDFHPITPSLWPKLAFAKGQTVPEFTRLFDQRTFVLLSRFELILKNSRFFSRVKSLFSQVTGLFFPRY